MTFHLLLTGQNSVTWPHEQLGNVVFLLCSHVFHLKLLCDKVVGSYWGITSSFYHIRCVIWGKSHDLSRHGDILPCINRYINWNRMCKWSSPDPGIYYAQSPFYILPVSKILECTVVALIFSNVASAPSASIWVLFPTKLPESAWNLLKHPIQASENSNKSQ